MAYADSIRTQTPTAEAIASLIEGIFSSGYPLTWTSWTPTYGATGSMTFTSVTTSQAKYIRIGKLILFMIQASGTTGGSAGAYLTFTLPVTSIGSIYSPLAGYIFDGSNYAPVPFIFTSTVAYVGKDAAANWGLGVQRAFSIMGIYEAA